MYLDPKTATEKQIVAEAKRIGEANGKGDPYPFESGYYEAWIGFLVRERDRLQRECGCLPDSIQDALNSGDGVYRP